MDFDDLIFPNSGTTAQDAEYYITDARYPADKDDIMYLARLNKAPDHIIAMLNQLPNRVYHTYDELDFYLNKVMF